MAQSIYPCIWFEGSSKEAAQFYCDIFPSTKILQEAGPVTVFSIGKSQIMALEGGPIFKPNPTVSYYMICETKAEINSVWDALVKEGKVLMPLDTYDWSERYGWIEDRYGISWQLTLGKISDLGQKVTPALLFVGAQFGKGTEALKYYTSIFPKSAVHLKELYGDDDELQKGKIKHSQFSLNGQKFILMDSGHMHNFQFTEGNSLVINCKTQEEIDHYWNSFTAEGEEGQCGWCKDKFGLSWQIAPEKMGEWMKDPEKAAKVTEAFLKMKKLDIEILKNA